MKSHSKLTHYVTTNCSNQATNINIIKWFIFKSIIKFTNFVIANFIILKNKIACYFLMDKLSFFENQRFQIVATRQVFLSNRFIFWMQSKFLNFLNRFKIFSSLIFYFFSVSDVFTRSICDIFKCLIWISSYFKP